MALQAVVGPETLPWGDTNASRHGIALIARTEYDHVQPVSLGGSSSGENLVTACPCCNYGKDRWTLSELGLEDPRSRQVVTSPWDGLISLLPALRLQARNAPQPLMSAVGHANVTRAALASRRQTHIGTSVNSTSASRQAFLSEVALRATGSVRSVDFAGIIDALFAWSEEPSRELAPRQPGDQHTVSYGLRDSGVVLWVAYPRRGDGAKVIVLPRIFRKLPDSTQRNLTALLAGVSSSVQIVGTGTLQVPMHLLTSERALNAFVGLLEVSRMAALDARL